MRALFFGVLFCAAGVEAREVLTVYSHRHYPVDREVFAQFERTYDVNIRVLQAHADELIERIAVEGARTPADVLITVSAIRLDRAVERGILVPFRSQRVMQDVPSGLRHPQNYWTAVTARARVIVYNPQSVRADEVARYQDLASSQWRGRVVARTSAHSYNVSLLASLIARYGTGAARRWMDGIAANLAYSPRGNDRDQIRAVQDGRADAAIVNSYYYALLFAAEKDQGSFAESLAISFPNQDEGGAHVDISGVGIVAHSANTERATQLIEFMLSDAIQRKYAVKNHEFPVHAQVVASGTAVSPVSAAWRAVVLDYDSIGVLSAHAGASVRMFDASAWK